MGPLKNEKMMRDGQLFWGCLTFYSGAKTRNKRKCISPAENIFRAFFLLNSSFPL